MTPRLQDGPSVKKETLGFQTNNLRDGFMIQGKKDISRQRMESSRLNIPQRGNALAITGAIKMNEIVNRQLTLKEACMMLDVSRSSLYSYVKAGRIPPVTTKARNWKYFLLDVVALADELYPPPYYPEQWRDYEGVFLRKLTHAQVAEMLGIKRSTLANRVTEGKPPLPFDSLRGKLDHPAFYLGEVVKYIDDPVVGTAHKKKGTKKNSAFQQVRMIATCLKCPDGKNKHEVVCVEGSSKWQYCKQHSFLRGV